MPQMAPLSWLILMLFFSIIFLFFNSLIFFCFLYSMDKKTFLKKKLTFNWKW